jgi:hypothetical protein
MLSNTAQTQRVVVHSTWHSAFNVLNILMVIGYIKEWYHASQTSVTHSCNFTCHNAYSLSKPGFTSPRNTLHSPQLLWTTHRFTAAVRNLLHLFTWLHTPTTSLNCLCNFFQKPHIFSSLLVNKHLLLQTADSKCFMETRITNKLIHHKETLCVLSSICDCCEVNSVYIEIPIFSDRTSRR